MRTLLRRGVGEEDAGQRGRQLTRLLVLAWSEFEEPLTHAQLASVERSGSLAQQPGVVHPRPVGGDARLESAQDDGV